ncbi:RluA family pseudouridine synthase [Virgibacillus sp. NKC19-3]|uniref:RluA family pseudouridine synthase n=1 Tax=Virgibacillus saliphilus TaxID=2831674 RepID=UPI001C9B7173|nr:RluA family pseudouridine synthase [Virgibacillus sp. NKC19-3]MBY7143705.1 RluA family pseudouridine synthase [Virgibacillus sp. NKC19-3]
MTLFYHTVNELQEKQRIDKVLAALNPEASRSQVQSWIVKGLVTVNKEYVKSNDKCQIGDVIEWSIPKEETLEIVAEDIPLSIVYEDSDLLVVNKPKGMVIHPSPGHTSGTLVNALLYHCDHLSSINGVQRPGIVHRIDKDTSGLLVVAKNNQVHAHLSDQLSTKEVKRVYTAIVHGKIPHETGMIDAPIGRDPKDRQRMGIVDDGKPAVTHFNVIKSYPDYTYVKCQLETGRTHQIRVHMKYIGYPLVGDPKYGRRKTMETNGQVLHAGVLGFMHPNMNRWMEFEVKAPAYFEAILSNIEKLY